MKKIRKWVSGLLAMLLVLGISQVSVSAFNSEVRESVAVVNCHIVSTSGYDWSLGWGSGFFIGNEGENPTYLVTNYHVISDFVDYGAGELTTFLIDDEEMDCRSSIRIYYSSEDYDEAYLVDYDETKDVAVLKLAEATSERTALKLLSPTDEMVGSSVYAVGYPGLSDNVFSGSTTTWGDSDSSVTSGIMSRLVTQSGTGVVNIQIDCDIHAGNSGGPLVTEDGAVLGITAWTVTETDSSDQVNYAISIDEVIPLLNVNGVEYEVYDEDSASASEDDVTAAAEETAESADTEDSADTEGSADTEATADTEGSADTGDSSDAEEQSADTENEEESAAAVAEESSAQEDQKSGSSMVIIAAVAGAIVAILAVLLILFVWKKKSSAGEAAKQEEAQMPKRTPYVRSLAAQHGGMRIALTEGQILAGRSQNDCKLVYSEDTPGVSSRHCSIAYDAESGDFILTDLNSTYGTYLQNQQKLTPGTSMHLHAGDHFYLGDSANMLTVELE